MKKKLIIGLVVVLVIGVSMNIANFLDNKHKSPATDPVNKELVEDTKKSEAAVTKPLPTKQNPACIVLTGTKPVEIPIFVPNEMKLCTRTYDDVNYRLKDKTWDEYVYRSAGIKNVTADRHIFEPVIALTDVHPDQKARIFYYVE